METKKILLASDGDESNGGIYPHEFDAMLKYAPKLAESTKVCLKDLPKFRSDFADIVLIYEHCHDPHSGRINTSTISYGQDIKKKGNVDVFMIVHSCMHPMLEELYYVWRIYTQFIVLYVCIKPVFYTFKRCGGMKLETFPSWDERNNGFSSIDWEKLQELVVPATT